MVTRYDLCGDWVGFEYSEEGEYVLFEDYEALRLALDKLFTAAETAKDVLFDNPPLHPGENYMLVAEEFDATIIKAGELLEVGVKEAREFQ